MGEAILSQPDLSYCGLVQSNGEVCPPCSLISSSKAVRKTISSDPGPSRCKVAQDDFLCTTHCPVTLSTNVESDKRLKGNVVASELAPSHYGTCLETYEDGTRESPWQDSFSETELPSTIGDPLSECEVSAANGSVSDSFSTNPCKSSSVPISLSETEQDAAFEASTSNHEPDQKRTVAAIFDRDLVFPDLPTNYAFQTFTTNVFFNSFIFQNSLSSTNLNTRFLQGNFNQALLGTTIINMFTHFLFLKCNFFITSSGPVSF